jgi:hypothetical protein
VQIFRQRLSLARQRIPHPDDRKLQAGRDHNIAEWPQIWHRPQIDAALP